MFHVSAADCRFADFTVYSVHRIKNASQAAFLHLLHKYHINNINLSFNVMTAVITDITCRNIISME